ncbi:DUF4115 domain-containing protein [Halomonas sp. ZH2S]|uniref:DUF4115 domain-containing protein n=1 Tax=Vreelandella zhuhanensis TaxID=2684210 RepID=A0A7X3GYU3_9GAMM|nr:RodZ domain-containing protein [Halomonas zhuhanensis]MWJ27261.1 DUF4115 domain-containing protein [Halomonas zhuhanensis]
MSETHNHETPENSVSRVSPSPGELLRRERAQLGLPLSDVAEALNLRPAVVDGLERDNYDEIPVPAYRRGYLRAYARHLGMDEQEVLDAYKAQAGSSEPERKVTSIQASRPPSHLGAWLFKLVTLLVIVGLIVVTAMWWQSRGGNEPPGFGGTSSEYEETGSQTGSEVPESLSESSSATQPETAQALAERSNALAEEEATGMSQGTQPTSPDAMASRDSAEVDPIVPQAEEEPTQGIASTDAEATTETATNQAVEEQETAPATNANTLELSFNEQSWTEIFDATNQRILVGLQSPDTQVSVEGQPPFRLTIGNATGVELRYQGEPVDLPARAGANNVARFTLKE